MMFPLEKVGMDISQLRAGRKGESVAPAACDVLASRDRDVLAATYVVAVLHCPLPAAGEWKDESLA